MSINTSSCFDKFLLKSGSLKSSRTLETWNLGLRRNSLRMTMLQNSQVILVVNSNHYLVCFVPRVFTYRILFPKATFSFKFGIINLRISFRLPVSFETISTAICLISSSIRIRKCQAGEEEGLINILNKVLLLASM